MGFFISMAVIGNRSCCNGCEDEEDEDAGEELNSVTDRLPSFDCASQFENVESFFDC